MDGLEKYDADWDHFAGVVLAPMIAVLKRVVEESDIRNAEADEEPSE